MGCLFNEMQQMFYEAKSFNHFIGDWNTSSVTNLNYMFSFADLFSKCLVGMSPWSQK